MQNEVSALRAARFSMLAVTCPTTSSPMTMACVSQMSCCIADMALIVATDGMHIKNHDNWQTAPLPSCLFFTESKIEFPCTGGDAVSPHQGGQHQYVASTALRSFRCNYSTNFITITIIIATAGNTTIAVMSIGVDGFQQTSLRLVLHVQPHASSTGDSINQSINHMHHLLHCRQEQQQQQQQQLLLLVQPIIIINSHNGNINVP
jgi:hypothetical protein